MLELLPVLAVGSVTLVSSPVAPGPLQGRFLKAPPQGVLPGLGGPRYPALEGRPPNPPGFPSLRYPPLCLQQGDPRVGYAGRNKPYEIVKGSDPFTIFPQQTCCLKSDVFPVGSPPGGKFTNSGGNDQCIPSPELFRTLRSEISSGNFFILLPSRLL